ncbi:MAG: hypothetical protein L0196_09315 [candidate division Zixibacteria bacterium]|nr:hypothetical protein [candidate division Zixibacteria bacterium]
MKDLTMWQRNWNPAITKQSARMFLLTSLLLFTAPYSNTLAQQVSPDLVITTNPIIVTPTIASPGSEVILSSWKVQNRGMRGVGTFNNGYYLSVDPIITRQDTKLGGNTNSQLGGIQLYEWPATTLIIPPNLAPGYYYLGIFVDESNAVLESDESNNFRSVGLTVALAELKVTSQLIVTPGGVSRGGTIKLSPLTVQNDGPVSSAPFRNGVYLSTDPVITTSDLKLGENTSGPVASGTSITMPAARYRIPGPVPLLESRQPITPGTYYVGVLVDEGNSTPESNEGNNFISVPLEVFGGPSDRHPVWRVQIRLETANVKGAGTDDDVNIRLGSTLDSTWVDYGRDDFERADVFVYDLGFSNGVTQLGDIQMLRVTKLGSDAWCLKKIELIVNGNLSAPIFSRTFEGEGKWLNATPTFIPGNPPRLQQNSVSLTIQYLDLRQDLAWQNRDPLTLPILPPFIEGNMSQLEIESRIESAVGDALFRAPSQSFGPWSGRAKWGRLYGRAVEASKHSTLNRIQVDLDLMIDIANFPDAELDVDFDIEMYCVCGNFTMKTTNLMVNVDSRWYHEALNLGVIAELTSGRILQGAILNQIQTLFQLIDHYIEEQVQAGIENSLSGMSGSFNINSTYCPVIKVESPGEIHFYFPPKGPDLVVSTPVQVTPSAVAPGSSTITLAPWTVLNQGNETSNPFTTGVYLRTSTGAGPLTANDIRLGGASGPALAACNSFTQSELSLRLPKATPAGKYRIIVFVDETDQTKELEERNNHRSVQLEVGYADLVISFCEESGILGSGVTYGHVPAGGTLTLSESVVGNIGVIASNPFSIGVYLSTDQKITPSDVRLSGSVYSPLPPTNRSTDFLSTTNPISGIWTRPNACNFRSADALVFPSQSITIPSTTAPDDYYVGILVDELDGTAEGPGETNNSVATLIHVP